METRYTKTVEIGSSCHSSASSTSALLRARAKAATAKIRAEYAKQEAKVKIERVKKETQTLVMCREAAAAAVWESAVKGNNNYIVLDEATEQNKFEWTSENIQTHCHFASYVQQTARKASPLSTQPTAHRTLTYSPNKPFASHHKFMMA